MADAVGFLNAFAQALSTLSLYPDGHATRERALDGVCVKLEDLLAEDAKPSFSFLGDEVVYRNTPLRELREWGWSRKLSDVGVQRLIFDKTTTRDELEDFVDEVLARITLQSIDTAEDSFGAGGAVRDRSASQELVRHQAAG